ncbi:MAG: DNA/RNA non-specific endonuclease, partial [Verrucomicrobia bacterium]|nr:DNA/RNA non-specific endonuclease [Cytophagales bacterium]
FEKKKDFVLPHYKMPGQLIRHQAYTLYYSDTYKQAVFVAYQLTAQETQGSADRKDDRFMPDPKVETTKVIPADYSGSGYDRGHLAPAADFKSSDELMQESFYMSNMSPQAPDLNRGIWRILEEQVRTWAKKDRAIYVLSGPELKPGLPTIGKRNKIPVPQRYFKIILYLQNPKPKAIAFIMPNRGSEESITKFATTIDAVEKMTGLDFFPALPDVMENDLESKINLNDWTWQKPRKMRNN